MADVHLPRVDDDEEPDPGAPPAAPLSPTGEASALKGAAPPRSRGLLKIGLDVLLIAAGVFLGLMGEQWREHAHERQLATESLRRFRAELQANREAVMTVREYHVKTKADLERYFELPRAQRKTGDVQVRGLQPVFFERTAWDLAIATQSLAYVDPQIAFALSRIYTLQHDYADQTRSVMQAMYVRTPTEDVDLFLGTVNVYYGDIVLWEPALLRMYDELLPQLDRVLGTPPANAASPPAASR